MFKRVIGSGLLFGAAALAPPAEAANCGPRAAVIERLQDRFGEQLAAGGLQNKGNLMVEIWASPDSGTFTVLVTQPTGLSCLVAAGDEFFALPLVPEVASEQG